MLHRTEWSAKEYAYHHRHEAARLGGWWQVHTHTCRRLKILRDCMNYWTMKTEDWTVVEEIVYYATILHIPYRKSDYVPTSDHRNDLR